MSRNENAYYQTNPSVLDSFRPQTQGNIGRPSSLMPRSLSNTKLPKSRNISSAQPYRG